MADTADTFGVKTVDRSGSAANTAYEVAKDKVIGGVHRTKEAHEAVMRFTEESPHAASMLFLLVGDSDRHSHRPQYSREELLPLDHLALPVSSHD